METPSEDIPKMECDMDVITDKLLSEWTWKTQEKGFGDGHDSLQSDSPESSFDSMCSSPETSTCSTGHQSLKNFSFGLPGYSPTRDATQRQTQIKPRMSTKRRMKASEREKMRMRSLAEALHHLREYLPPDYRKRGQPLTKIQTLKYTIEYINKLSEILSHT